jgi:hypothetical protein
MSNPTTEVVLTYEQGTQLLQMCNEEHPKEFGQEQKFQVDTLRTYDRNSRHLFKAIKKESPGFQARPKMIPLFGDPKKWKERPKRTMKVSDGRGGMQDMLVPGQPEEPTYDLQEPLAELTLHLNAYAIDALESMLVILSHPFSQRHLPPATQESIVWELAERMKIVPWLEGQIGLKPERQEAKKEEPAAGPAKV